MKKVFACSLNVACVALAVAGLLYGVEWAENILIFTVWVATIAGTMAAFAPSVNAELKAKGPTAPRWLAVSTDIATASMFAAVGHFGYAAMVVWQIACESNIYDLEAK